ncbi:MAG: hypothetical protein LBE12_20695 [Planctomycetaceae bacterium]|nr:hypothetical protein [Planctomycetaceae bacterium]
MISLIRQSLMQIITNYRKESMSAANGINFNNPINRIEFPIFGNIVWKTP